MAVRRADSDRLRFADCVAVVALDVISSRFRAGRGGCDLVGGRGREAVRAEDLPRQDRVGAAAAGVLLERLAEVCGHCIRRKRRSVNCRAAVGQAVADRLQAVRFQIVAFFKFGSAACRSDRADTAVLLDVLDLACVIAARDLRSGVVAQAAGDARDLAEGISGLYNVVAADDRADVIAVGDRGSAAAVAGDARNGDAAGQRARVEARHDGRAVHICGDAAGAAAAVLVCNGDERRTVFDASIVLVGNDAARVGLIAAHAGQLERDAAGNGQVADRSLAVAEEALIGVTLAVEVADGMSGAVEGAAEIIAVGIAHRLPKLAAKVNVLGKHRVCVVAAADGVDLVCKPRKLLAGFDTIPAGHACIVAGGLFRRDLVRLGHRLAVPTGADKQLDRKVQRLIGNGEIGGFLGRALRFDKVVVRTGDQLVSAGFVGRHDLAVRIRDRDLRLAGSLGLRHFKRDRVSRELNERDGKLGVLRQHDLARRRLVAVGTGGVGVGSLAEVIDVVRAGLRIAACVLQDDRRVLRRDREGQVIANLLPDGKEGLVIRTDGVFFLIGVVCLRCGAPRRPAEEAIALAGKQVLADLLRNAVSKGLRLHCALAAVGVKAQSKGLGRPRGGIGHVGADHRSAFELLFAVKPAREVIAGAGRRGNVAAERVALLDQNGLGRDAAAVGIKDDRPALRPMRIEGEAAAFRRGDGGVRRDRLAAFGRRVPAVKDHAGVRRDGKRAVGEGGGVCVPFILAEGRAEDRAAGGAVAGPLDRVDLIRSAPAVALFQLAAVGVPSDVIDRRCIGGRDRGVLGRHRRRRLVPLHAHAYNIDGRIGDLRAVLHFAVGVLVVAARNGIVAGVPRQGIAVSLIEELEHKVRGCLSAEHVVLVLRVEGKALDLGGVGSDRLIRLRLLFGRVAQHVAVARHVLQIGLHLILDGSVGILPRLPRQNGVAVRAVRPVFAERFGQGGKLRSRFLGAVAAIVRKRGIQVIAIGC